MLVSMASRKRLKEACTLLQVAWLPHLCQNPHNLLMSNHYFRIYNRVAIHALPPVHCSDVSHFVMLARSSPWHEVGCNTHLFAHLGVPSWLPMHVRLWRAKLINSSQLHILFAVVSILHYEWVINISNACTVCKVVAGVLAGFACHDPWAS